MTEPKQKNKQQPAKGFRETVTGGSHMRNQVLIIAVCAVVGASTWAFAQERKAETTSASYEARRAVEAGKYFKDMAAIGGFWGWLRPPVAQRRRIKLVN